MRCVSYNIQYGIGRDGKYDLKRIAASLQGADIIALQEVTRNFIRNGGTDLVAGLAGLFADHFYVYGPAMDVDFGGRDARGKPANQRLQFGNMILSRWPIDSTRNLVLPRSRSFGRGNLQRAALEALIGTPLGPIRFYSVHLDHVSHEERLRQIAHLKERVYAYPMEGGAITGAEEYGFPEPPCPEAFVLMGDFNMHPGSPEYFAMCGEPDAVYGRQVVAHHPVDVSMLAGEPPQRTISYIDVADPARNARLDYGFVHASLVTYVCNVEIDGRAEGSDHLPLWFEMK